MGIIWYGTKKVNIGIGEFFIKCPACEADEFADVSFMNLHRE